MATPRNYASLKSDRDAFPEVFLSKSIFQAKAPDTDNPMAYPDRIWWPSRGLPRFG